MIRELICYRCVCAKCKHTWVTKSHDLPLVCPKCKSRTWNVDFSFADDFAHAQPVTKPAAYSNEIPTSNEVTDDVVEDGPDEWAGWSDEQEEYDGTTGETIIFRRQLVKPFRVQKIRSEH